MIFVTEAPNDRDLLPFFGGLATTAPIPHGDFCFFGLWYEKKPVRVCGERKKIGDLVNCAQSTGRYLKQVQDAREAGFDFVFLVVEGRMRVGEKTGLLEIPKPPGVRKIASELPKPTGRWIEFFPPIEYRRVDDYLNQVQFYLDVRLKRSESPRETAQIVMDAYVMFQKPPEEHQSLKQFYSPSAPLQLYGAPSLLRKVAKELPGIGWERSKKVEEKFRSVRRMCEAEEKEWREVEGIGSTIAKRVVKAIEEEIE